MVKDREKLMMTLPRLEPGQESGTLPLHHYSPEKGKGWKVKTFIAILFSLNNKGTA